MNLCPAVAMMNTYLYLLQDELELKKMSNKLREETSNIRAFAFCMSDNRTYFLWNSVLASGRNPNCKCNSTHFSSQTREALRVLF